MGSFSRPEDSEGANGGRGELVEMASVNNVAEAEMIRGLLESGGIPSLVKQIGVDGPMLGHGLLNPGGGSRRILVHAGHLDEARSLLAEALVDDEETGWPEPANARYLDEAEGGRKPRDYGLVGAYARIWVWSLGAMALAFGVFMLLRVV